MKEWQGQGRAKAVNLLRLKSKSSNFLIIFVFSKNEMQPSCLLTQVTSPMVTMFMTPMSSSSMRNSRSTIRSRWQMVISSAQGAAKMISLVEGTRCLRRRQRSGRRACTPACARWRGGGRWPRAAQRRGRVAAERAGDEKLVNVCAIEKQRDVEHTRSKQA